MRTFGRRRRSADCKTHTQKKQPNKFADIFEIVRLCLLLDSLSICQIQSNQIKLQRFSSFRNQHIKCSRNEDISLCVQLKCESMDDKKREKHANKQTTCADAFYSGSNWRVHQLDYKLNMCTAFLSV